MGIKRLVDARYLTSQMYLICEACQTENIFIDAIIDEIDNAPDVDAVELPCKIGDWVWAIRSYHGKKHPQRGIVSDMYFSQDMRLQIVVKHIARGEWGKTVFSTDKEAYEVIEERKDNDSQG